jgi:hypothetical protein
MSCSRSAGCRPAQSWRSCSRETSTLITGLVRVAQIDVGLGTLWVAWGLVGVALSLALGATMIRATNAALRRLAADASPDDPRWPALLRRMATLYGINLLLLVSVVWAMEFKPS